MNRRELIRLFGGSALVWSALAHAQYDKRPVKIGLVPLGSPNNTYDRSLVEAFRQGLRQADDADATFVLARQAAGEADDALLRSAILAHAAFVPGWAGHGDEYADRMRAARTYARRAPASAEFLAWPDAVEAECETISGHPREAPPSIDPTTAPPGIRRLRG